MEITVAVVVFGALLAIALVGLAISNRQARMNNASRHAGAPTVHPHDQRKMTDTPAERSRSSL